MFTRLARRYAGLACLGLLGCDVPSGNLAETIPAAVTVDEAPPVSAEPVKAVPTRDCTRAPGASRAEQACHRWSCERDVAPAAWNGDAKACRAGALDTDAEERAMRDLNLHRWLAGMPELVSEPAWSPAAQACALMAHANDKLSHHPGKDWSCWSKVGADTSAVSLVANRSAAPSIAAFFEDPGNEETMVHRRWLLSGAITRVGLGSTDRYACVVVDGRALPAPTASVTPAVASTWTAWPPPGPVPLDVFRTEKLDTAGWTFQTAADDLDGVKVSVTVDGEPLPVKTTKLQDWEGSRAAVRFVPVGWTAEAGRSYAVKVGDVDYVVEPTACL